MTKPTTYRDAGVDIDAGDALVERIMPYARATMRKGAMGSLGGFGALFDLKAAGYKDPILVSTTDGVGTKLKIAQEVGRHDTIGIDLVAMCVNDLIVQGAEPLFFLDYFATGKLKVGVAEQVIKGIADGCKQAGCALVGGETAEMPGMYPEGEYDLAGFAVGIVEREHLLPKPEISYGDVVLGLASSGVHSNGFSLVRRIIERHHIHYASPVEGEGQTIGEILLTPTRIYVQSILKVLGAFPVEIKALAHITGGGLIENTARVLPKDMCLHADWDAPKLFKWLQRIGNVPSAEMIRTFNMGIGMVIVVSRTVGEAVTQFLESCGEKVLPLGEVAAHELVSFR